MRLSVMTFNVRGSFHDDGANVWSQRRDLTIATIDERAPDILGLQEAQHGNLQTVTAELSGYDREQGPCSVRDGIHDEYEPIYWKRDRFTKMDAGGFYLSETPDVESAAWGSHLVRAATWVRLRDPASDTEFVVLNTHFPHELDNETGRARSARLIIDRLAGIAPGLPQVVMADFNTVPGSDAYQVFTDNGYADTYAAAGQPDAASTYHGFQGSDFAATGYRIDWILTRDGTRRWATHRCEVITAAAPPLYPSDHYPVLAELDLS